MSFGIWSTYPIGERRLSHDRTDLVQLTQNALDYLLLAGEQAGEGSSRMLKHALATLADGIELLLKARLETHDWSLLFKNVDDAKRSKFEQGDFQSVSFDQAVKRLENICSVTLDQEQLVIVEQLRQLRNRIRHFAVETDRPLAVSLITKAYSFAIDFITKEIEPHRHDEVEYELGDLRSMLGDFAEFVQTRLSEIQSTLDEQNYSVHVSCPACLQSTFYADGDGASCAFCGLKREGESAARLWANRFCPQSYKDEMIEPVVVNCPECGAEACVPAGESDDFSTQYVCLSCGESGDYQHCSSCGQLHGDDNPGDMCDGCWQALLDNNP